MKRLHSHTKIFFPNPYVVRVEYPLDTMHEFAAEDAYRKLTRRTYRQIPGTWGYCPPEAEMVKKTNTPTPVITPSSPPNLIIASLFNHDFDYVMRGYFCFKDELDALQFRLSIDTTSVQVHMWPERWFTIHEVVETDDN